MGQHWLKDQASLEAICQAADIQSGEVVLEIGPGTGELTKVLLDAGADVKALEFDRDLIEGLRREFASKQVEIIEGDIRKFDLNQLPQGYKIVANIPYYLTANLLRILVDTDNKPMAASLLVQKEVAERVAAVPGQMSFISVAAQLNYEVSLGAVVEAELFTPPPKVDSQVLILKRLAEPMFSDINQAEFLKFIKAGFAQPRKTLANNLSSLVSQRGTNFDRSAIEAHLVELNLQPTARAQELSLSTWHTLYLNLP